MYVSSPWSRVKLRGFIRYAHSLAWLNGNVGHVFCAPSGPHNTSKVEAESILLRTLAHVHQVDLPRNLCSSGGRHPSLPTTMKITLCKFSLNNLPACHEPAHAGGRAFRSKKEANPPAPYPHAGLQSSMKSVALQPHHDQRSSVLLMRMQPHWRS